MNRHRVRFVGLSTARLCRVLPLQWTPHQLVPIISVTYKRNSVLRRQGSQVRSEASFARRQTHQRSECARRARAVGPSQSCRARQRLKRPLYGAFSFFVRQGRTSQPDKPAGAGLDARNFRACLNLEFEAFCLNGDLSDRCSGSRTALFLVPTLQARFDPARPREAR